MKYKEYIKLFCIHILENIKILFSLNEKMKYLNEHLKYGGNMHKRLFLCLVLIIFLHTTSFAGGIDWLKNMQNDDGSWGDSNLLGFLETIEVLQTFVAVSETSGVNDGLLYLENRFPENTDFIARKLSLFARANRDFYSIQQQLLSQRNMEGRFGFSQNYQSSTWETALALNALKDAGLDMDELYPSIQFLVTNQNTDGGFGYFQGDSSRTQSTAYSLYVLSRFKSVPGVPSAIERMVDWLKVQQNPDSGFGDEGSTIYETALSWLALRSVNMATQERKEALNHIYVRQDANGSWNNSIYETALALRVINTGLQPNLFTNADLITFTPEHPNKGDTVLINAQIVNNGDSESPSALVRFDWEYTTIGEDSTPAILPQDTGNVQILWPTVGIAGHQTITITIDPEDGIQELHEDDNIASKSIFIQDTLPPETLDVWVSNPFFSPNNDGVKDYTRIYFSASEEVNVDILVRDDDMNVVKTIFSNQYYTPGTYSAIWDGTNDNGLFVEDGDYLFEVKLTDMGNNSEIRNAFVCVDVNKSTIFSSLDPNRIVVKRVYDGSIQDYSKYKYYPETDQYIFLGKRKYSNEIYLIVSDAKRSYMDTLDQDIYWGFYDLCLIPSQQILFYRTERSWDLSPVFGYDLVTHTKKVVIEDSCGSFSVSPDGAKIAYIKYNESWELNLYIADSDGTNKTLIHENAGYGKIWSPNGQYLLYSADNQLWKTDRNGNKSLLLDNIPENSIFPIPSNSGDKFALFLGDSLYVINSDGSNQELLAILPEIPLPPPPMRRQTHFTWHPDDREILVLTSLEILEYRGGKVDTLVEGVSRINISTKESIPLDIIPWGTDRICYTEGGKRIVYLGNNWTFYTCNLMGEEKDTVLSQDHFQVGLPGWPIDFTADYTAMLPTDCHYAYSLNNLTVEIKSLARLYPTPDMLTIMGTVFDRNLDYFTVEYGIGQTPSQFFPVYEGNYCVDDTIITAWVPPKSGYYTIKLTGFDKAGNVLSDSKLINWDWETVITDLRANPDFISPDGDGINDTTTISYYLVHPEPLTFKIQREGTIYKTIFENHGEPGSYSFKWDGKDNYGQIVPDGTYKLKVFGMSISITVDSASPIVSVDAQSGFKMRIIPTLTIEGLAYDYNFKQFKLEYANEDTSEFCTILMGNNPVFRTYPPDTLKWPAPLVNLDLRNCIGENYFRLTAEDILGHKKIALNSFSVDSLQVGCTIDSINGLLIYFNPFVAMAKLQNISNVEFFFRPVNWSTYFDIGQGTLYPNEDYLYTLTKGYFIPDSSFVWEDSLAWAKCIVTCQGGTTKQDSILLDLRNVPGFEIGGGAPVDQFILIPADSAHISGLVDVTANYYINQQPHPDFLNEVTFSYKDGDIWHNIGSTIYNPPFQTVWNTYGISAGWFKLRAIGVDTTGKNHTKIHSVFVDNTTPIVSFASPSDGNFVEDTITINVNAFPNPVAQQYGAEIDYVTIQFIDGSDTTVIATDSVSPYLTEFITNSYPDEFYKLRARAFETFGNEGSAVINIVIDNTKPSVSITDPIEGANFVNEDTIEVSGQVFDKYISYYKLDYQKFDGLWKKIKVDSFNIEGIIAHWDVRSLESGDYYLRLFGFDKIGHADTSQITITIENSPAPTVELYNPISGSFINDTCIISGKVEDNDLICWVLSYGKGNSPTEWTKIDSAASNFEGQFTVWDTELLTDTVYTIKLWAIDEIGRTNEARATITIDNTVPLASITEPTHEQYVGEPIPIIGTASDKNLSSYTVEVGEGVSPNYWEKIKTGTINITEDTLAQLDPLPGTGTWTIKLFVEDKANNNSERWVPVVIDTLPPAPPIGLSLQDSLQQVILSWDANQEPDLAGYNAYRNGSKINQSIIPSPFYEDSVFVDGNYTYYVTALDNFNLVSEPSDSVSIDIDVTKPMVNISDPYNNQRIHGTVDIIGTANDNHFESYTIEIGEGSSPEEWTFLTQSYTPVISGKLATWDTEDKDSIWSIRLRAEDTFGNKDTTKIAVYVDNIPPSAPQGLTATASYDTVTLNWLPNPEPDIDGYQLFRDSVLVNPSQLISDTFYVETRPDGIYSYYLIAVDLAENHSGPSDTISIEIDIQSPHALITDPEQGERVANTVNIISYVEDNDVKDVTFEFKPEPDTFESIGVDSIPPFTMNWETDTLDPGKYYLRAIAEDYHNNIDPNPESIYVFVTKDLEPPSVPQGLVASLENDTIYLSWLPNPEPDIAGYNIYEDTDKLNKELVADTNYTYIPPYQYHYYFFSITALDTATNESGHSQTVEVDYYKPDIYISSPQYYHPQYYQHVKGIVPITGSVYDKYLDHYVVSYGLGSNPAQWDTITVDSEVVYNDTLAVWNTYGLSDSIYSIKLEAIDEFENYSSGAIPVYVDYTPPAPPQNLTAELLADSSIHVTWDNNTEPDLKGYNVYYSLNSGSGYVQLNMEIIYTNSYDTNLPGGNTYYFVATALDLVDNESGYSNEDSITPPVEDIDIAVEDEDIAIYPPSPVAGDTATVVVDVHNLGTVGAQDVQCDFYIKQEGNFNYLGMDTIPELPPNSTVAVSVKWNTEGYSGTDTVYVFADPNDMITETNEENNNARKEVIVRLTDIVWSTALDDSIYEPYTDVECHLSIVNLNLETIDFLARFSIIDSLDDTLNSGYDIETFLYVDDSVPQGGIPFGDFYWDTTLFYRGTQSITHAPQTGEYEYGFSDAETPLIIQSEQAIVQYIYLDPQNIPSEIMVEFQDKEGSKEHRAYWGANLIDRGIDNTDSRRYMGELPQPDRWNRLVVPADTVGLSDTEIKGASYVLYNGKANWDLLDIGLREFEFSLAQGDSLTSDLFWNTKNALGGMYDFHTSLTFNSQTDSQKLPFRILEIPDIEVDVHTDKVEYVSYDDLTIISTITNQSPNYTYHGITENIVILDTMGTPFYDTTRTIDMLPPQATIETEFYWNTGYTPPGVYKVFDCLTKDGDTLTNDSTLFYITPSGGADIRLSGTIEAEPKIVVYPDSFEINYQVTNIGNITIDTLPIRTQILDGETLDTLVTYLDTLNSLDPGETETDTFDQSSTDYLLKPYALTFDALVEDTILNISVGGFIVTDATPPFIISILPSGVVGGIINIQTQISDDISGVDSAFYKIAEEYLPLTKISGDSLLGNYSAQFNTSPLPDGDYYLKVKAIDKKDNQAVDSVSIIIDNTPPEITITGVSDSAYYNHDVTPVITITEPNLDSTSILLNGEPYTSGTTITDDDEYTLCVYAKDLAGNESETSLFFIVDKTEPAITISGVSDSTWYNHDVTPVITITDVHLDSSYNTLNGNPFTSGTTVSQEGDYMLYSWAIDMASNVSDTSLFFVIDKTPPSPPVMTSPPESSTVASSPITIEGTAEPGASVTLNIEGILYEMEANAYGQFTMENVELNSGWNPLKFTARDKAANVSDTAYYHLKLGVGIELETSIYIPQEFARVLLFAKDDSTFVKSILDSMEVFYKLVNNRSDFEDEFHSGIYNLYLIAGKKCKLHPHIQDEIIEMVNLGDGLVVTTRGTQHMKRFEEVFSVKFKGHIPAKKINSVIFLESPISEPDTLSISAKVVKFEVKNSTLCAQFNTGNPAAVVNEYGDGRTVFFGFDATDVDSGIKQYIVNALSYTTPDTSIVYPGATIPVEIYIKNLSDEQQLNVIEVTPIDFTIIAALDSGEISGHTITWNFPIQNGETEYLRSVIELPDQEFTDTISAEISYLSEGSYVAYDTLYLEISTESDVDGYIRDQIDETINEIEKNILFNKESHETANDVIPLLIESKNVFSLDRDKSIENLISAIHRIAPVEEFSNVRKRIDLIIKTIFSTYQPVKKGGQYKK
jgi:flagellar hook assembly protein FlgD